MCWGGGGGVREAHEAVNFRSDVPSVVVKVIAWGGSSHMNG